MLQTRNRINIHFHRCIGLHRWNKRRAYVKCKKEIGMTLADISRVTLIGGAGTINN